MYRIKHNHGAVALGLPNTNKIERNGFVKHKQLKVIDNNECRFGVVLTPFSSWKKLPEEHNNKIINYMQSHAISFALIESDWKTTDGEKSLSNKQHFIQYYLTIKQLSTFNFITSIT